MESREKKFCHCTQNMAQWIRRHASKYKRSKFLFKHSRMNTINKFSFMRIYRSSKCGALAWSHIRTLGLVLN